MGGELGIIPGDEITLPEDRRAGTNDGERMDDGSVLGGRFGEKAGYGGTVGVAQPK